MADLLRPPKPHVAPALAPSPSVVILSFDDAPSTYFSLGKTLRLQEPKTHLVCEKKEVHLDNLFYVEESIICLVKYHHLEIQIVTTARATLRILSRSSSFMLGKEKRHIYYKDKAMFNYNLHHTSYKTIDEYSWGFMPTGTLSKPRHLRLLLCQINLIKSLSNDECFYIPILGTQQHRHLSFVFVFVSGQPCSGDLQPLVQKRLSSRSASLRHHALQEHNSLNLALRCFVIVFSSVSEPRARDWLAINNYLQQYVCYYGDYKHCFLAFTGGDVHKWLCKYISLLCTLQNSSQKIKDVVKCINFQSSKADCVFGDHNTLSDDKVEVAVLYPGMRPTILRIRLRLGFEGYSATIFLLSNRSNIHRSYLNRTRVMQEK
ncbi:hypothetical protein Fmac_021202 [Flemingia macrophylla]|uniref:F-box protein Hrt3/FBXO9 C-terminal domain-containing protein n=1 Tax=Flemingia macrophylla TaxID=520843 RepID=A0ABD1LW86_9FABA